MPQSITVSVKATIPGGPIGNDARLDVASYAPFEETICRCSTGVIELPISDFSRVNMIVIAAEKYTNDKDCTPANGKPNCKCIQFVFDEKEVTDEPPSHDKKADPA